MKKSILLLLAGAICLFCTTPTQAQGLLKKLKEKVNKTAEKAMDKKVDEAVGTGDNNNTDNQNPNTQTSRSGRPTNKTGAGLQSTTPPDVAQQITDAKTAHAAGKYSDARFAVQQALKGVEIQIGRAILKMMPPTVSNLPADTTQDKVISTNFGWDNLSIMRTYTKDDKQLEITVGNNSFYSGWINLYFTNTYMQNSAETEGVKQIKVKDNKAIIKYDANEGYTVLMPLGQTGTIVWLGINFATEPEMLNAVNAFDIEGIKKMMGEK